MPVHIRAPDAALDLRTEKVATIVGSVDEERARNFDLQYAVTSHLPGDRLIIIDSLGGSVGAGEYMLRLMREERLTGVRQVCLVLRTASSMAFNILTQCDVRLALPRANMLMHKIAWTGVDCISRRCTARYLRELAKNIEEGDERYRRDNAAALKMSIKDYDLFADNDHIWRAEELEKRGYLQGLADFEE